MDNSIEKQREEIRWDKGGGLQRTKGDRFDWPRHHITRALLMYTYSVA